MEKKQRLNQCVKLKLLWTTRWNNMVGLWILPAMEIIMDTYEHIRKPKRTRTTPIRKTYRQGWDLYRFAMISHHLQGAIMCGFVLWGSISLQWIATIWFVGYIAYQFACFPRKRDAMGLDILDFLVGTISVLILFVLIQSVSIWF